MSKFALDRTHGRTRGNTHQRVTRGDGLLASLAILLTLLFGGFAGPAVASEPAGRFAGILDNQSSKEQPVRPESIIEEVKAEQKVLREASPATVEQLAHQGERLAQVELGNAFAREATKLAFAPAAANAALGDAIRWYSLAAMRGFPGALSLDRSGVSFYPIRVKRKVRP